MNKKNKSNAPEWQAFQEEVAALFPKSHGWSTRVNHPVQGARIGVVHVDVLAVYRPPRKNVFAPRGQDRDHGFPFTVIIECKFWKTPIPQEKLFVLKTVVEDVGASLGILVSEMGIQQGATGYLAHPVNIVALTFNELKAVVSGFSFANCTECGKVTLIPFPRDPYPTDSDKRPLYCRECFQKKNRF